MRIISKFHDYYDSVQSYGTDDTLYVRKTETIENESIYNYFKDILDKATTTMYRDLHFGVFIDEVTVILFCGKVYTLLVCRTPKKSRGHIQTFDHHVLYDTDSFSKLINKKDKKAVKEFNNSRSWRANTRRKLDKFFSYSGSIYGDALELHFEYKTPIIKLSKDPRNGISIEKDSELKRYKFFKVLDTYTCFQELSMFISGVMGGQCPPMIEISDKVRLEKHGFDKWSFRKHKDD